MEEFLVAILSMFLIVALIPLYIWKRRQDSQSANEQDEPNEVRQTETVVRATGARRMRRRRDSSGASTSSAAASALEESIDESDEEAVPGEHYEAKASKKKEKKRQEREARRQAEDSAHESRHTKQDHYSEMRRRKDEERKEQELKLEEEAKAQKAREEESAALEFEKWKDEFSVDAEGTTENEVQDGSQGLLSDFVDYIKTQKCVLLEDLAAEFKLRTQECINRISSLESMGKYIYIAQEEMKAVADYIKRQGRVSISHLASKSNQFIDLEPKAQFIEETRNVVEITVN